MARAARFAALPDDLRRNVGGAECPTLHLRQPRAAINVARSPDGKFQAFAGFCLTMNLRNV
jgi:hypothetical protein